MRIAIDVRKLRDFGIGTYVNNLVRQLARLDRRTEYVLLTRPEDADEVAELGANFRTVLLRAPNYSVREQVAVPLSLSRTGATLFHAPHYVLPPLAPCRTIVTIHDCIPSGFRSTCRTASRTPTPGANAGPRRAARGRYSPSRRPRRKTSCTSSISPNRR